ncbi:hypothetical protein [Vibrio phage Va2]|nr:hypothetical protein [Vibrio phage Va2]
MLIVVVSNLSKKRIKEINEARLQTLSAKELQGRLDVKRQIKEICDTCPWK